MSATEGGRHVAHGITYAQTGPRKRKVQQACEACRRRKIQCDGSQMAGRKCSTCVTNNLDCTYAEAKRKRRSTKEYVASLESRLEQVEKLLAKAYADPNVSQRLTVQSSHEGAPTEIYTAKVSPKPIATRQTLIGSATLRSGDQTSPVEEPVSTDEEIDNFDLKLSDSIRNMEINPTPHRFFGKSSGLALIQHAIDLKSEHTGDRGHNMFDIFYRPRSEFLARHLLDIPSKNEESLFMFPEPDLSRQLIDLYFTYTNSVAPLLHRPTFERKYADGLHLRDSAFGAVFLLMCAVAAPWCEDTGVLLPEGIDEYLAGWQWFEQVQSVRKTVMLFGPPCLEDLQICCLSALYLQGTSAPHICWTVVGIGIRLAQDVGAHRRKVYNNKLTVEDELWKRAFWVLVSLDRTLGAGWGRPCAIHDEDFDLDLPAVCDDEYWEHPDPEQAFKQPPEKPSSVAFFVSSIKLNQIIAFALRTIYSINKSKVLLGFVGQQWEQRILSELDSALNKWIGSVPDHLRWDPNMQNPTFLLQSCMLYTSYYFTQIIVHRPFIPSPRRPSSLPIPSLAICTNAARSCCHVIEGYMQRVATRPCGPLLHVGIQRAAVTAGIVLLVNIWGGRRSGLAADPAKDTTDIRKCMDALKQCERRFYCATRFRHLLQDLSSVSYRPLSEARPSGPGERTREEDMSYAASVPSLHSTVAAMRDAGEGQESGNAADRTCPDARGDDLQPQSQPQSQGLQQPSPYFTPALSDFDTLETWLASGAGGLDLFSMMNQNRSNEGASTSAAPHVPYGLDDFLCRTMSGGSAGETGEADAGVNGGLDDMDGVHRTNEMYGAPDADTIAMWSNAPSGLQLDDWDLHSSSMFVENDSRAHPHHQPESNPRA